MKSIHESIFKSISWNCCCFIGIPCDSLSIFQTHDYKRK